MTTKERLLQAIERTPEQLLHQVLAFLNYLNWENSRFDQESSGGLNSAMPAQDGNFRALAGILHRPGQSAISLDEMDQAIAQGSMESL